MTTTNDETGVGLHVQIHPGHFLAPVTLGKSPKLSKPLLLHLLDEDHHKAEVSLLNLYSN